MLCSCPDTEAAEYNPWPSFKFMGKLRPYPTVSVSPSVLHNSSSVHDGTHVHAPEFRHKSVVCITACCSVCGSDAVMSVPACHTALTEPKETCS